MRTKRSAQFIRKATQTLQQDPNFPAPHPLPVEPKQRPNFQDPTRLAGLASLVRDGMTVIMPAVQPHWPAASLDDTQVLPVVSEPLPPSARHTDPVRHYYEQVMVEDDGMEPESRGKHVLDELKAEPDPVLEVADLPQRVIADFGGPDTVAKDPARRDSVRRFRHARDMQRSREARAAAAISSADETLRRIHDTFNAWDEKLREWNAALCGQEATIAGYSLAAAYEENRRRIAEANARRVAEGQPPLDATATTFTRGMAAELQQLIVQRATAGSGAAA